MKLEFTYATVIDAEAIGTLVVDLTNEICERTNTQYFDIELETTITRCKELLSNGQYLAILGWFKNKPIAVATFNETYALYAGGKIGVIHEFYVKTEYRSTGIGKLLVEEVQKYGKENNWSCIELCTPPLPEFEETLRFYKKNGLAPVGGRKMRLNITE